MFEQFFTAGTPFISYCGTPLFVAIAFCHFPAIRAFIPAVEAIFFYGAAEKRIYSGSTTINIT